MAARRREWKNFSRKSQLSSLFPSVCGKNFPRRLVRASTLDSGPLRKSRNDGQHACQVDVPFHADALAVEVEHLRSTIAQAGGRLRHVERADHDVRHYLAQLLRGLAGPDPAASQDQLSAAL